MHHNLSVLMTCLALNIFIRRENILKIEDILGCCNGVAIFDLLAGSFAA
jgi:hypothetical protein